MPTAMPAPASMSRRCRRCGIAGKTTPSFATRTSGRFYDTGKVHEINHKGKHFSVKGPLNVPRPVQGHPVVVQAGQSEDGRKLAAHSAEVIFTAHQNLASAQEFYRDIKKRVRAAGRNPDHVLIMPGVAPFVGRTEAEAQEKYQQLTELILPEDGVALLNGLAGQTLDLRGYPLDGPLPPSAETEGMKSRQALIRQIADEHGFTIRQLYQWIATARGHYTVVGSAEQVADQLESWFHNEAADGFNILPPWLPGALRRLRRPGDPGTAAPRAVPHRIRRVGRCAKTSACRGRRTPGLPRARTCSPPNSPQPELRR